MQWGAGNQQPCSRGKGLELSKQLRVEVLHTVTFVNDDELPVDLAEGSTVVHDHFVASANYRKLLGGPASMHVLHDLSFEDLATLVRRAMVHDDGDGWNPFVEFVEPIGQGAQGGHDEMWSQIVLLFSQQCDEGDRLDGFTCDNCQWP